MEGLSVPAPSAQGTYLKETELSRSLCAHVSVLAVWFFRPLMAWLRTPNTGWVYESRQHSEGKNIPERGQRMEGGALMADQAPRLKRQLMQLSPDPKV